MVEEAGGGTKDSWAGGRKPHRGRTQPRLAQGQGKVSDVTPSSSGTRESKWCYPV